MLKSMVLGNEALLNCEKIGFLASRRVPPEAVMRCLDRATRMRDEGVCVMSGFQSPLEKGVLNILLKGTSPPHSRPCAADVGRTAHSHALPQAACRGAASRRLARLVVHPPRRRPFRRPTQPLHPRPRRQPLPRCARSRRLADRPPSATLAFI